MKYTYERYSHMSCNMSKPWWHYAKWNKPVAKGEILYDYYCEIPRVVKYIGTERKYYVCQGLQVKSKESYS